MSVAKSDPLVRPHRAVLALGRLLRPVKMTRTDLGRYASGILLLSAIAAARAQTTWNYVISDAGGGNSLLTWSVGGSLATPPGAVLTSFVSSMAISINAPGIFADAFVAVGSPQSIPAPDGSYFQLDNTTVYSPIELFSASNAPGSGNDSFGLAGPLFAHQGDPGHQFLYHPGTQSALIPIDYSNFNPGTYQSQQFQFDTPVTVNLTVSLAPEPSTLTLLGFGGLSVLVLFRRGGAAPDPARRSRDQEGASGQWSVVSW